MSRDAEEMDWFRRGAVECRSLIGKAREKSMFDDYSITYWPEQCSITLFAHLHQNSSSFAAAAVVVA